MDKMIERAKELYNTLGMFNFKKDTKSITKELRKVRREAIEECVEIASCRRTQVIIKDKIRNLLEAV